jgi:hypothetical protein
VLVALDLFKADGTVVKAEFLRPREWGDRLGLRAGAPLPIAVTELEVEGDALVTAITPCPPIATGAGRVVTGRFMTQAAGNLVRVVLADGTEFRATDVHPVWSVDREEWVPAGELLFGELLDTLAGPVAVERVERLESPLDVYNIEVHGEHVFRVTADGVLVHNACNPAREAAIARYGEAAMKGWEAAHIIPRNGWAWADEALGKIIERVTEAKLIDDIDVNIFYSNAGHMGTHTQKYVVDLIRVMKGRFSGPEMKNGINLLWQRIKAGEYVK